MRCAPSTRNSSRPVLKSTARGAGPTRYLEARLAGAADSSHAGVIPSIVGMDVGGLPLVHDRSGFIVTMLILIRGLGLAFLILKRFGMLQR